MRENKILRMEPGFLPLLLLMTQVASNPLEVDLSLGFLVESKVIQNSKEITLEEVTITSKFENSLVRLQTPLISMENQAKTFKDFRFFSDTELKKVIGNLDIAKSKFSQAKQNLVMLFNKLGNETANEPRSTCRLDLPIIKENIITEESQTLQTKLAKISPSWNPADINAEKLEILKDFVSYYEQTADNFFQSSHDSLALWEGLLEHKPPPSLNAYMEQLNCVDDAVFNKISIKSCQLHRLGLICELTVHVAKEIEDLMYMQPVAYQNICLGKHENNIHIVKSMDDKLTFLNCPERIQDTNMLCSKEELNKNCELSLNNLNIPDSIYYCPFYKCKHTNYHTLMDGSILIDGEDVEKVSLGPHLITHDPPYMLYHKEEVKMEGKAGNVIIPPNSGHPTNKIIRSTITDAQIWWLDFELQFYDFINSISTIDWAHVTTISIEILVAIFALVKYCWNKTHPHSSRHSLKMAKRKRKQNFRVARELLQEDSV